MLAGNQRTQIGALIAHVLESLYRLDKTLPGIGSGAAKFTMQVLPSKEYGDFFKKALKIDPASFEEVLDLPSAVDLINGAMESQNVNVFESHILPVAEEIGVDARNSAIANKSESENAAFFKIKLYQVLVFIIMDAIYQAYFLQENLKELLSLYKELQAEAEREIANHRYMLAAQWLEMDKKIKQQLLEMLKEHEQRMALLDAYSGTLFRQIEVFENNIRSSRRDCINEVITYAAEIQVGHQKTFEGMTQENIHLFYDKYVTIREIVTRQLLEIDRQLAKERQKTRTVEQHNGRAPRVLSYRERDLVRQKSDIVARSNEAIKKWGDHTGNKFINSSSEPEIFKQHLHAFENHGKTSAALKVHVTHIVTNVTKIFDNQDEIKRTESVKEQEKALAKKQGISKLQAVDSQKAEEVLKDTKAVYQQQEKVSQQQEKVFQQQEKLFQQQEMYASAKAQHGIIEEKGNTGVKQSFQDISDVQELHSNLKQLRPEAFVDNNLPVHIDNFSMAKLLDFEMSDALFSTQGADELDARNLSLEDIEPAQFDTANSNLPRR